MHEIRKWAYSGHLCRYENGVLIEEREHSPIRSDVSELLVLASEHEATVALLKQQELDRDSEYRKALNDLTRAHNERSEAIRQLEILTEAYRCRFETATGHFDGPMDEPMNRAREFLSDLRTNSPSKKLPQ